MNNQPNNDGKNLRASFDALLAPYAQKNADSRGRKFPEIPDENRLPFQRDRDRIIHTNAFRRLKGKMQVVSASKGDHFRNRLSHTLEVTQIARDLARQLKLNEDLAESIALAHDLGHTPFGHAGETALHEKMKAYGLSFEHNEQSLRVVEIFESRYEKFQGLNLTFEVLEGLQKHQTFFDRPNQEFIYSPHLESQLVDIADEIAYFSADLEDGMRGGFFNLKDLQSLFIPHLAFERLENHEQENSFAFIRKIHKVLFDEITKDTLQNIEKQKINTLADVQKTKERIVAFSPEFVIHFQELKKFLFEKYYSAPEIITVTKRGKQIVSDIFDFLQKNTKFIPSDFFPQEKIESRICDYIAGMTDDFAEKFWEKNISIIKKG